jgi:hypothetical protein
VIYPIEDFKILSVFRPVLYAIVVTCLSKTAIYGSIWSCGSKVLFEGIKSNN